MKLRESRVTLSALISLILSIPATFLSIVSASPSDGASWLEVILYVEFWMFYIRGYIAFALFGFVVSLVALLSQRGRAAT